MVLNEIQTAFQVDSLASSHPLSCEENDIQSPSDITEQFDDISYSKVDKQRDRQTDRQTDRKIQTDRTCNSMFTPQGAALLRMLADYISKGSFILGVKVRRHLGCSG